MVYMCNSDTRFVPCVATRPNLSKIRRLQKSPRLPRGKSRRRQLRSTDSAMNRRQRSLKVEHIPSNCQNILPSAVLVSSVSVPAVNASD